MKQQLRREENVWSLPGNWDRRRQWRWNFCAGLVVTGSGDDGGAGLLCYLCSLLRHSVFFCLCSFAPFLSPYSAFVCVSFCAIYSSSFSFPYAFSLSVFFLLFLSASPFFFLFFYKAREGFVLVGRLDNSRETCPVIETISAFNDETSSFILLLKPLLRRRRWTVVHETSLFLQFKWPFWFGPCGFTICNQILDKL